MADVLGTLATGALKLRNPVALAGLFIVAAAVVLEKLGSGMSTVSVVAIGFIGILAIVVALIPTVLKSLHENHRGIVFLATLAMLLGFSFATTRMVIAGESGPSGHGEPDVARGDATPPLAVAAAPSPAPATTTTTTAPTGGGAERSALPDEPTAAGHPASDPRVRLRLRDVESLRITAASSVQLPRPLPGGRVSVAPATASRPGLAVAAEAMSMRPIPASAPVVDRSLLGTLRDAATIGFKSRDEAVRVVQAHKS